MGPHPWHPKQASSSDEYYPAFAIGKLIKILLDQSLSSYHQMVVQAVMFIFRTLGKWTPYFLFARKLPSEEETPQKVSRTFTSKTRPASGLECLICAEKN